MALKILNGIDVIGSMNIAAADVPSLDASKITSGTINASRIPNLDAGKITSGTINASRIPSIDASKINSGALAASRLPDLSGTYALASHNHDSAYATINHNHDGVYARASHTHSYLPLAGGTLTGDLTTSGNIKGANLQISSTTPTIYFNGTNDGGDYTGSDMAIKATPEGLDFYEPEDGNKVHFQILDDAGVNAPYGYKWNGQSLDARYAAASHTHNYDNYGSWNLKTNGSQRTTVGSGGNLDLVAGNNVSLSYGAGGVVTISSTDTDTNTWRGIHDTPVNGATTTSISSNWAYDHANASNPHGITLAGLGFTGATNANYITNNNQLTNGAGYITGVAWGDVTGKPSTFTPSAHTHGLAEIDGLEAALDDKQPVGSYLTTSGKAADSNLLDGINSTSFLRSDQNDTMSGTLTINGSNGVSRLRIEGTTPTIDLDDADGDSFYIHVNSNSFYVLADRDGAGNYGTWETPHPLQLRADTNKTYLFGNEIKSAAFAATSEFDSAGSAAAAQANAIAHADNRIDTEVIPVIGEKLDASVNPIKGATVSNDTITFTKADNSTFTITTSDANTNYYLNGITKSGNTLTFSVNGTTNQTYTFGDAAFQNAAGMSVGEAGYAPEAGFATQAASAWTANEAEYATDAGFANVAAQADYAASAGEAGYATTSGEAAYAVSAGSATNLGSYYTADSWLRATSDNNTVKLYGNSRMMVFRTDGEGGDTGHTGYAFKWTYGGDGTGNTLMLLDNNGNVWTKTYGWLHSRFETAGAAGDVNNRIDNEVLPAIPTNNNQLTNGAGYVTYEGEVAFASQAASAWSADEAIYAQSAGEVNYAFNAGSAETAGYANSAGEANYAFEAGSVNWNAITGKPTIPTFYSPDMFAYQNANLGDGTNMRVNSQTYNGTTNVTMFGGNFLIQETGWYEIIYNIHVGSVGWGNSGPYMELNGEPIPGSDTMHYFFEGGQKFTFNCKFIVYLSQSNILYTKWKNGPENPYGGFYIESHALPNTGLITFRRLS